MKEVNFQKLTKISLNLYEDASGARWNIKWKRNKG